MSTPTIGHWNRLKRAARYLKTHRRRLQEYRRQQPTSLIDIFADSDWVSDKTDRKSESCVVTLIEEHCIRCQTATQSATALSSGEAGYERNVKIGSFGIGVHPMARDFGDERVVLITTDKGVTSRLELGKIRHLDTGLLFLLQPLKTSESENQQTWAPKTSQKKT